RWLAAEEKKFAQELLLVVTERERRRRFSSIEMRDEFFAKRDLRLCLLVAAARSFGLAIGALLHGGEVGEDQLGVDDLDVAHGIDVARDVMNVAVLKTAHDLHDRIDLADVAEELVAEPFARARAFHEPRDVHELDRRRNDLLRAA